MADGLGGQTSGDACCEAHNVLSYYGCVRSGKTIKAQSTNAQKAIEKLAHEPSRTENNLRAEMVAAEKLLDAEKAPVESLIHEPATEFEKKQPVLT